LRGIFAQTLFQSNSDLHIRQEEMKMDLLLLPRMARGWGLIKTWQIHNTYNFEANKWSRRFLQKFPRSRWGSKFWRRSKPI